MGLLKRLLTVHSIADSVGFYVPAKMLQKALGFVRLLLLTYLIGRTQCGLWGLGMMLFTVAAPLLAVGANHGLTRYVVLYEARGMLREFYRRMRWTATRGARCHGPRFAICARSSAPRSISASISSKSSARSAIAAPRFAIFPTPSR